MGILNAALRRGSALTSSVVRSCVKPEGGTEDSEMLMAIRRGVPRSFFIVCIVFSNALAMSDDAVLLPSTPAILEALNNACQRITAFEIEYQAVEPSDSAYIHRQLAVRGPDRCYFRTAKAAMSADVAAGAIGDEWRRDYFQEVFILANEKRLRILPVSRQYEDDAWPATRRLPSKINYEFLFAALGWWPLVSRPFPESANGARLVIPDIVRSGEYQVDPKVETERGIACCVLESPGRDRIVLDPRRGYAFVSREFYDPTSSRPVQRIEMSNHKEVVTGIWMPFHFRNIYYDMDTEVAARVIEKDASIVVISAHVGKLSNTGYFQFDIQPGMLSVSDDATYEQCVPGGVSAIEDAVSCARGYRAGFVLSPAAQGGWQALVVAACAMLFVLMTAVYRPVRRIRERDRVLPARWCRDQRIPEKEQ